MRNNQKQRTIRTYKLYMYVYTIICLILLSCLFLLTNKILFELLGLPNILETFAVVNSIHMFMAVAFVILLLMMLFILISAIALIDKRIKKIKKIN